MSHPEHNPSIEDSPSRVTPHQPVHSKKAASVGNAPCVASDKAAAAAAGFKGGRHRSLRNVEGERRDLAAEKDMTKPLVSCRDDVDDGLRRQEGTTSLLRVVQRSPARTCLVFTSVLIFVVVALVTLSIALFIRNASKRSEDSGHQLEMRETSSTQAALCGKEACRRMGSLLKDSLDVRRDPCEDFHEYVCGSWPTKHPGRSVAQVLASAFRNNVTRRAKDVRIPYALETTKQTAVQKAARHLVACDDIVAEEDDQSAYVGEVLAEGVLAWPDGGVDGNTSSDVLDSMIYMSQVVKIPVLLEVTLMSGSKQRVVIRRPKNAASVLAASSWRINNMTSRKYEEYFRAVYGALSQRKNTSDFRERASKMSRLETALMSSVSPSLSTHHSKGKDGAVFTDLMRIQSLSPSISKKRWLKAFRSSLNISDKNSVLVVIHDRRYFRAVFALHKKLGEDDFAELYGWLCAQVLVPFTSRRIIAKAAIPDSQDAVLETHRERCFADSDRVFHYALEYPYLSDVVTAGVRDDVGKLMQRMGRSFVNVLSRAKSAALRDKCTSDALEKSASAYTGLFRRTVPEYFDDLYESYPDMTLSAVTNWISTAPYVSALNGSYVQGNFGDAVGERHGGAWRTDMEASYLDVPWYAVDAPSAIKIAGIGSRIVVRLFSELILRQKTCEKAVFTEIEAAWRCMASAMNEQLLDYGAIKKDVVSVMITRSILWDAFRGRTGYRMNGTVLEDYPDLPESALFFVFGCLWSCGEDIDVAKTLCNLPLRHDVNFAETFSCVPGSPMRPEVQCPHAFSASPMD
ncbi:EEF1AKMT4-ECE2 readthrough transcript protein-like [Rhipicephalus sanguineus]|uniref:EEF1AKMT4-ECE2 readthrough transcript protein-like n=1 Tax=Rhipicephalus sanguineus TaxID=34632 RepID=UPI0018960178|nr:EEF1AKMT4-ECE2 readthrough transcript protein-like [Rhipicephalus sanguineus]XP_037507176.1 EEF1AKMT4-ECE2 readthrough transcript protein-like [Rhipicephalus sanguineus]